MARKSNTDPVLGRVGANVTRIRADRTQADLATGVGCVATTISRIESGTYTSLDVTMCTRLAVALGCQLTDLFDGCDMALDIVRYRNNAA